MIYRFGDFELDTAMIELRRQGVAIAIERQVFATICLLVENRDRVVSKEELVQRIWDGRSISDSAISSRIKSARKALGDNGRVQGLIRTVHRVGFRFTGDAVTVGANAQPAAVTLHADAPQSPAIDTARPSIAVLPFRLIGASDPRAAIADALPQDLITELARLRWLFVIARGSSFRFRGDNQDLAQVQAQLNVRYCLCGSVEFAGETTIISAELCDLADRGIVWSDRFRIRLGAVHEIREEIVRTIISALELRIPLNEAQRARLKSPDDLNAWSVYHLGLQHMYRFTKADNAIVTGLFERAVLLDPKFARAYAGLSFTHFQDAFLDYGGDVSGATRRAERYAAQCLELDPIEPFGNLTMGRTFLLHGDLEGSLPWLERATELNPSYAQAKYSRAWTKALLGQGASSQTDIDAALALSPLDPLRYAMLRMRAISHIVSDEIEDAVSWADSAARTPGAHCLTELTAAIAHGLNDNDVEARMWAASARVRAPKLTREGFLQAFPFREQRTRRLVTDTLERVGF